MLGDGVFSFAAANRRELLLYTPQRPVAVNCRSASFQLSMNSSTSMEFAVYSEDVAAPVDNAVLWKLSLDRATGRQRPALDVAVGITSKLPRGLLRGMTGQMSSAVLDWGGLWAARNRRSVSS